MESSIKVCYTYVVGDWVKGNVLYFVLLVIDVVT